MSPAAGATTTIHEALQALGAAVRGADPDVRDALLIGSAVYAPDLARDYDVVVTTQASEDECARLLSRVSDAVNNCADRPVDLILRRPGDEIGALAVAILAGRTLLGEGQTRTEALWEPSKALVAAGFRANSLGLLRRFPPPAGRDHRMLI